jgi:hypothetical protein
MEGKKKTITMDYSETLKRWLILHLLDHCPRTCRTWNTLNSDEQSIFWKQTEKIGLFALLCCIITFPLWLVINSYFVMMMYQSMQIQILMASTTVILLVEVIPSLIVALLGPSLAAAKIIGSIHPNQRRLDLGDNI